MTDYEPKLYTSPINLTRRRVGTMEIRHRTIKAGEDVIIVGMRQALLRGVRPVRCTLPTDLRIHELVEHKGKQYSLWMTDLPEELNQIGEMLHTIRPQGDILVGGLGLGILAGMVAKLEDAMHVQVVERSADVIELCRSKDYGVVRSDILRFLKNSRRLFDFYLLDTWAGTNEGTWWGTVLPLRRAIRQRHGIAPEIHCWAEDIMWGQVGRALMMQGTSGYAPTWYYKYLPCPMKEDEVAAFLNMAGTPWWERQYGHLVDKFVDEQKSRRVS